MKYLILFILLYFVGVLQFFRSAMLLQLVFYGTILIGILSSIYYFTKKKTSKLSIAFITFAFVFPIYASYQSEMIFGQPFYMGVASLRYFWVILFVFFLYLVKYPYAVILKQINTINLTIAIISILLFFFAGIHNGNIQPYLFDTNTIEINYSTASEKVKGIRLTQCSSYMVISYIYYLIAFLLKPKDRKILFYLSILLIYLVFVNKSRQFLAIVGIVYFVFFLRMKALSTKRIIMALLPIIAFIIIVYIDDTIINRFSVITAGTKTTDSSTMARINSVNSILPYIQKHFLLGFGNLSSQFREYGFQTYFGKNFYLADIGIWAALARGGIVLLVIYYYIYYYTYKGVNKMNSFFYRTYLNYMLFSFIVLSVIFCADVFYTSGCISFAFLFYPCLGKSTKIYV